MANKKGNSSNFNFRSSVTGQYVKPSYAVKHKATTEKERK